MAIRKRGNGWQLDYNDLNGKRFQKIFKKKIDAMAESKVKQKFQR